MTTNIAESYPRAFELAYNRVVNHEGGFQDMATDRGNWTTGIVGKGQNKGTKYGISAMTFPDEDIVNLTPERAKLLTYNHFWRNAGCNNFRPSVAFQYFDASYNHGQGNAVRMIQRAVGVSDDGLFGPITAQACRDMDGIDLITLFNAERLDFMTRISTWPTYGRGWVRRVTGNMRYSVTDTEA